jgi:GDP-L-fucose synthase
LKEEYLLTGLLEPTNEPYAIAKISAIKLCRYYNEQYGTNFISVMPTNLYGINDNFNLQTSHVLPALIRKMHLGKCLEQDDIASIRADLKKYPLNSSGIHHISNEEVIGMLSHYGIKLTAPTQNSSLLTPHSSRVSIELWGSGKPFREFLFVDDLAEACLFLMEQYGASDIGEFVNIGTGSDITISDLAMLTKDIIGFQGEITRDASKPDGTPRKLLDVSKITSLGWQARTSLAEGIRKTYDWYASNSSNK